MSSHKLCEPDAATASSSFAPSGAPIRVVDVFNTDRAAKSLGMNRALRINQSGRFENLIVCGDGPFVQTMRERGLRVFTTSIPRRIAPLEMWRCAGRIARLLENQNCTMIHSHGSTAAVCARLGARQAGIPLVIHTVHGFHFHERMGRFRRSVYVQAERMLTRYTDLLLFQNQEDLTESLRHGIQARWGNLKIGNGIHLGQLVRMDRQEQDPPVVLTIGRLEPVKNQAFLLRAARRAADRGARFQLWFAGAGPLLESHRRLAASLGLADRSRFFGYVSNVPDLIRQASLAVLPSIKEGIPRGLLEPMAAGVPVVASDVKGNRETVCHGKTGWLVPLDDDEALAQTLHIALADRELRQRMGVAAAQSIRENFDEDRVVDRLMDVYESLVARSGVAVR